MIGILLALKVNNWNNDRQRLKLETKLLLQVDEELQGMLNDMEDDLILLEKGIDCHFNIERYIEYDLPYADTMCFDFHWIYKDEYVYPINTGYEVIKAQGLDIIRNDSIRDYLQACFDFMFPRISRQEAFYPDIEEFLSDYYQENFSPNKDTSLHYSLPLTDGLILKYPFRRSFGASEKVIAIGFVPNDFEALKKDSQFKMLLKQSLRYRLYKVDRYRSSKEMVILLQQLIEEELGSGR